MRPGQRKLKLKLKERFQSTHSLRSATVLIVRGLVSRWMFQSTHSLRSATRTGAVETMIEQVSIHALLAECDLLNKMKKNTYVSFNPRTPCGVRRRWIGLRAGINPFQSTHSLRSATHVDFPEKPEGHGFNPRTPCGVRRRPSPWRNTNSSFQSTHSLRSATVGPQGPSGPQGVSIHALLAECDQ